MPVCYRHPSRETGVSCSSCGRPICPDCMTPTSVGMRCPECARERTKVRRLPQRGPVGSLSGLSATNVLIAINVVVFLAETASGAPLGGGGGGTVWRDGALFGPSITPNNPFSAFFPGTHAYWRLITGGFLHDGFLHILFNMFFLWVMGRMLEPAIGRLNFVLVYVVSLLAGSFGALLFEPLAPTVGASGACFGILGALIVIAYHRGISIWQSGLGLTLVINLVFSLSVAGISIGGHLGGLVGGGLCGWMIVQFGERRRRPAALVAGCLLIAAVSIAAGIAVAGGTGLTPHGMTL